MANADGVTESLWTAAPAAAAVSGRCVGEWQATGVSIDSRSIAGGDLFIALRGPANNGHDFVADALARGAAAAMVDHVPEGVAADAPLLLVADTQTGLESLGAAARARTAAKVVAITGSAGKTGSKEMLRVALERQARTHASEASYNNMWGVPLSLARMPRATEFGVFEIGMNHAGEITPLTKLARPHAAIVTTIAPAHVGHFNSLTEIAEAKSEIFLGLEPGGLAIINQDSAFFDLLSRRAKDAGAARVLGFGSAADSAARLIKAVHHADCSCVYAEICGQPLTYKIGFSGAHWVMNSLATLTAVQVLGGDLALAAIALAGMHPLAGRGRRHYLPVADGVFTLIDESYNANPGSMQAALLNLSGQMTEGRGRRIAVLGDMAELGQDSARYHSELAQVIEDGRIQQTFTAGTQMQVLHDALPLKLRAAHAADANALIAPLREALRPGDVVVVKGSYSSGMGKIVKALLALAGTDQQKQEAAHAPSKGG
ncbi:MAG: UDP-N-acetylmuramoylalanyl-D-glutamyl-2,6-diaminopimelate--D-alanyl-D-alanine ligase [Alphaproteobacteria bacterium]